MGIPFGKAHEQWKALKQKENKQGTKNVDGLFKVALGPTLDKFDAACKANDRPKAKEQAAKLNGILPQYVTISSKLKLAGEFKTKLAEIHQYVSDNLDACLPSKTPSAYKYMKQGNDGLCAFYALYHFTNGDLSKEQFIQKASSYYKDKLSMTDSDAQEFARDGNDPAVLAAFGKHAVALGEGPAYIVADVSKGHFWTVRKVDDVWWLYDGLKGKPEVLGLQKAMAAHVSGKTVFA